MEEFPICLSLYHLPKSETRKMCILLELRSLSLLLFILKIYSLQVSGFIQCIVPVKFPYVSIADDCAIFKLT